MELIRNEERQNGTFAGIGPYERSVCLGATATSIPGEEIQVCRIAAKESSRMDTEPGILPDSIGNHHYNQGQHLLVARFETLHPQLSTLITKLRRVTDLSKTSKLSSEIAAGLRELDRLLEEADSTLPKRNNENNEIANSNHNNSISFMDSSRNLSAWQLQKYYDATSSLRNRYRQAALEARKNCHKLESLNRNELFSTSTGATSTSVSPSSLNNIRKRGELETLKASRDLTYSMEQAAKMLQNELDRSAQLSLSLQQSTQTIVKTNEEYTKFTTLLRISRGLIGNLFRKESLDRALIVVGLLIFFSVVTIIFYRRISWMIPNMSVVTIPGKFVYKAVMGNPDMERTEL